MIPVPPWVPEQIDTRQPGGVVIRVYTGPADPAPVVVEQLIPATTSDELVEHFAELAADMTIHVDGLMALAGYDGDTGVLLGGGVFESQPRQ